MNVGWVPHSGKLLLKCYTMLFQFFSPSYLMFTETCSKFVFYRQRYSLPELTDFLNFKGNEKDVLNIKRDLYVKEVLRKASVIPCDTEIPVDVRPSCSKYGYTYIPHTYCIDLQLSKSFDVSWIKQSFCIIIHVHYTSCLLCKLNSQTNMRLYTRISMFSPYPSGICCKIFHCLPNEEEEAHDKWYIYLHNHKVERHDGMNFICWCPTTHNENWFCACW